MHSRKKIWIWIQYMHCFHLEEARKALDERKALVKRRAFVKREEQENRFDFINFYSCIVYG